MQRGTRPMASARENALGSSIGAETSSVGAAGFTGTRSHRKVDQRFQKSVVRSSVSSSREAPVDRFEGARSISPRSVEYERQVAGPDGEGAGEGGCVRSLG